jgi:hypothetical protein
MCYGKGCHPMCVLVSFTRVSNAIRDRGAVDEINYICNYI